MDEFKHRTFEDLIKEDKELQKLDKEWQEFNKKSKKDPNEKIDLLLRTRELIVTSIQAGNYYDYDDAHNVAEHYGVAQCDWSQYGCSKYDF